VARFLALLPVLGLTVSYFFLSAATARAGIVQAPSTAAATEGYGGLVSVDGGRRLYLECHGSGSPTVILEAGYGNSGGIWSEPPHLGKTSVAATVASFTQVCVYDRPGTGLDPDDTERPSLSDAVAQPRTASDVVADLHTLLHLAGVPGPYVLAGHSMGGLFARLYTSMYPEDVAGIVLVDSRPDGLFDQLRPQMTPEQWGALMWILLTPPDREGVDRYGLEDYDVSGLDAVMSEAASTAPLGDMPLAVVAHGLPWGVPASISGFSPEAMDSAWYLAEKNLALLVPYSRFFVADDSGHFVQLDQPEIVTEAIREVVAGVRDSDTWYDMSSCCASR
jgi:pimeloyl-ACP methyl ester carboxylesterase